LQCNALDESKTYFQSLAEAEGGRSQLTLLCFFSAFRNSCCSFTRVFLYSLWERISTGDGAPTMSSAEDKRDACYSREYLQ